MLPESPSLPLTKLQMRIGWLAASIAYPRARVAAGALAEFLAALDDDPAAGQVLPAQDVRLLRRVTSAELSFLPGEHVTQAQEFIERWRRDHPEIEFW